MTRQYSVRCVRPAPVSRSLNHYPVYSLIGTCKLNGVEPESYLRYVLDVIADWYDKPGRRTAPLARSTAD
ncbi:transposase domain-containing protein [Escherichia coli]